MSARRPEVRIYTMPGGFGRTEPILNYTLGDVKGKILSVAFSEDSRLLACGAGGDSETEGLIGVYAIGDGMPPFLRYTLGATSYVFSVAFSLDGKYLACGLMDSTQENNTRINGTSTNDIQ